MERRLPDFVRLLRLGTPREERFRNLSVSAEACVMKRCPSVLIARADGIGRVFVTLARARRRVLVQQKRDDLVQAEPSCEVERGSPVIVGRERLCVVLKQHRHRLGTRVEEMGDCGGAHRDVKRRRSLEGDE